MKSRKQRSVRAGSSRKKVPSDVSPSTSLPPLVEGQLRCFLQVTVSRVLWTVHKPPPSTFVRLRWWGESSNGTYFFPRDASQMPQKTIQTTARFPIRCGPKQFTSYLTDMGCLVLEVVTKPDHLPVARAQVVGISRLSVSYPIGGFYTLVSPTSEKLGELQVSLNLEALTEAYGSLSSGPITDTVIDGPQVTTLTVPPQPRSLPIGSGNESPGGSSGNTPRGKDHLYFQNAEKEKSKEASLENQMPRTMAVDSSSQQPHGEISNDILSVILDRGNKLRNAMVVSALKCDMDSGPALKDTPLPLPKDNILQFSKPSSTPSGMFLQNILHADSTVKHSDDVAVVTDLDCPTDIDNRAVDLLLGSLNTSPLPLWDGEGSPPECLSSSSSVCGASELNDPQYDQSLLENLFYKTPLPDISLNDVEAEGQVKGSSSKKHLTHSGSKISGSPPSKLQNSAGDEGISPVLSEEQMTLLSLIRTARVTINCLTVTSTSPTITPRKASSKGKPPRPLTNKKCTYFVEYAFPRTALISHRDRSRSGDGEVTRAVASKVSGGVVKFHHHSIFPVHLSTATVKQWWETDLIFKIYSRRSDQKKPVLIGKAVHPLNSLMQNKQLSQSVVLPVRSVERNAETQEIGPLKVSLELAADNKSLTSKKNIVELAPRETSSSRPAPSTQRETSLHADGREELLAGSCENSRLNVWSPQKPTKEPSPHPTLHTSPQKPQRQVEVEPEVLLHTLLMVPDGKNFTCGSLQAPNVYLNCKLFWCDETARSVVSWGQANPTFNFVQVTPVALTSKLLERMKNNVIVIEVWQKIGSSGQDRLLGLVKLPLHQFYMSFRDPKIAHLLLQAQYPVLGVDCYMPVIDVFSGSCKGNLRVVLALGRSEQIIALQRTRDEEYDSLSHLVRPVHLLDRESHSKTKVISAQAMREHLFVIRVDKVNGLTPLQSTVWGEADCYVQYSFPCQDDDPATKEDHDLIECNLNLKLFRTTTALCVPDPMFGHIETHALLAPEGVPVQRLLLSSLSSQGLSSGGGVQFEVWCRYYYPNVRDQLVAKAMLPLSKLCAMVTMQRQNPKETQTFSLPLIPRTDDPAGSQSQPSGLLDVCIQYKHRPVRSEGQTGKGAASRVVTLGIQVHRAAGLQAAARVLTEQDERFSYFASVGVNTYVTVQLSFLPEREKRSTRIAAKTFCPEFDHHMELSCDILIQRSSGETCSLAEQLEEASAVFTVWNIDNRKVVTQNPKEVKLGTVTVPLADLIYKRTGISGWFGVYTPQETSSSQQLILAGGLEISINFAHHSDRERVIKAAHGVGWVIAQNEMQDEEEVWEDCRRKMSLTFSMPQVWIPVHCLLLPGHSELQRSTYCYFRYKFYDQEAFCSQMRHPSVKELGGESKATVAFQGSRSVELRGTLPLMWYLREERLEVQVWVAFTKDKTERPRDTDRLVGSAFVDLSSLAKTSKPKLTLSGVYPLFRRSAADLQGAALRVHITLTEGMVPEDVCAGLHTHVDSDSQEELLLEEEEAADQASSHTRPKHDMKCKDMQSKDVQSKHKDTDMLFVQYKETSMDDSFPVTVAVDRAMHLNLKGCPLAERSGASPCCCVSFATADSAGAVSTAVIADTDCPVWDHQHECRLSKQLLVDPQQSLVFKVWHKGEVERVLGFASVDLSPLLCGFLSVCGWYNITDFSGQCHGQLKVSITPLKGVQDLRVQRKTVNEEPAKNSSAIYQALPLSYHTTATYSSFPSHISRYPEQKISSPERSSRLFPEMSSESNRHCEHMDKVRLYHQTLHEQTAASSVCSSSPGDINPSSSFLFSALRKKLGELDNIQRYFSRKLSTPTFPSTCEQDIPSKSEEEGDTEMDSCQLLLKSNHLVGEVNNIISGLRGHRLETIASVSHSSSTSFPVGDKNPQTIPETISSPCTALDFFQEDIVPLSSPMPKISEGQTDSEPEEEKEIKSCDAAVSEDEHEEGQNEDVGEGCSQDEDSEDHEDEDFEEVVLMPRPLNEVTSLTDKTSPWTSILSDPDLVSLEEPEEPNLSQGEDENKQMVNLQTCDGGGKYECASREESEDCDSDHSSAGDASDSDREDEQTLQASDETRVKDISDEGPGDRSLSPTSQHTDTFEASFTLDNDDTTLPLSVPVEVPNFFLPSHQLEASMRTIRLAPSFSQSTCDPGRTSLGPRGPRQRPNMSPSSMRKETDRIAKIFAAHFDDSS